MIALLLVVIGYVSLIFIAHTARAVFLKQNKPIEIPKRECPPHAWRYDTLGKMYCSNCVKLVSEL